MKYIAHPLREHINPQTIAEWCKRLFDYDMKKTKKRFFKNIVIFAIDGYELPPGLQLQEEFLDIHAKIIKKLASLETIRLTKVKEEKFSPFTDKYAFYLRYFNRGVTCACCETNEKEMESLVENPLTEPYFDFVPVYQNAKIYSQENCLVLCSKCAKAKPSSISVRDFICIQNHGEESLNTVKAGLMEEMLKPIAEDMPWWLENYKKDEILDLQEILLSRTLYYPGYGHDPNPILTFNKARTCHAFIYVNSQWRKDECLLKKLKGYHVFDEAYCSFESIVKNRLKFNQQLDVRGLSLIIYILERDDDYDETIGAKRIAFLSLIDDETEIYEYLFCNGNGVKPPFIIVLQDYQGYRGKKKFGGGSPMEELAIDANVLPDFYLVASNTEKWQNSIRANDPNAVCGGVSHYSRRLYRRTNFN